MSEAVPPNPAPPVAPQQPPQIQFNMPKLDWKQTANKLRLWLLIVGGTVFVLFYTPLFYVSVSEKEDGKWISIPKSGECCFGWNFWWGILGFILATVLTILVTLDLFVPALKGLRKIWNLAYVIGWGIIALVTVLGFILAICGVGFGFPSNENLSLFRFPIMGFLYVPVALAGALISFFIFTGKDVSLQQLAQMAHVPHGTHGAPPATPPSA